jgi:E3 ubiquitin-protein ligase UBR1
MRSTFLSSVASHFASVYPRVIDSYLLVDREADTSIKYFALQLFTVPSAALHVVQHYEMISRVLAMISAFFTNQIYGKRIRYPPDPSVVIDVETEPFKSKRFMPVFSDLRYLCHNPPVQQLIAHDHRFISEFAKTCQLFMGISPNKRAAHSHVEFETDGWIAVFNVTLSLSRVIKAYGEAFAKATPAELAQAISTVVHHILATVTLAEDRLDKTKYEPISFHDVTFGDATYAVVDFDVMEGWVSFHHSLQWLLAELFKHVEKLSEESLRELGLRSIRDILLRNASEKAVLSIIDFPLRGGYSSSK